MSRLGSRVLALSLHLSKVGNALKKSFKERSVVDLGTRLSSVISESAILWRLSRRGGYQRLENESTDLFRKSLGFTLVDPTEYLKFNIVCNYSRGPNAEGTFPPGSVVKEFAQLDDVL